MAQLQDTTFANLVLPEGTTAQRPGSPVAGMTRYNTSLNLIAFLIHNTKRNKVN